MISGCSAYVSVSTQALANAFKSPCRYDLGCPVQHLPTLKCPNFSVFKMPSADIWLRFSLGECIQVSSASLFPGCPAHVSACAFECYSSSVPGCHAPLKPPQTQLAAGLKGPFAGPCKPCLELCTRGCSTGKGALTGGPISVRTCA